MKEGTSYFLVKAYLPVVESFGFAQGNIIENRNTIDINYEFDFLIF